MSMYLNTVWEVAEYFNSGSIVKVDEFIEFWDSLTSGERKYYLTTPLD